MINRTDTGRLRGGDLAGYLRRWRLANPDKPALRHLSDVRTYGELDARASRVAGALAVVGVRRGDRVGVLAGNRLEVLDVFFGILRLGAIVVPLNSRLHPEEISYQVTDSGCGVVIGEGPLLEQKVDGLAAATVFVMDPPEEPARGWLDLGSAMSAADPHEGELIDDGEPAFIMYTSGTTGRAKGATLSHRNLVTRTYCGLLGMGVRSSDEVWYSGLPLFHIGGWCSVLMYLFVGGTVIVAPTGRFDPAAALTEIAAQGVTGAFFVPTQWDAVCAAAERRPAPPPLRRIVWGASPATFQTLERLATTFPGVPVISAFGQTEMSSATCMLSGEDSVRKRGSVGQALPGVAVRIVDEDMRDVPVGEVGEIVYQGPTVFLGYWGLPAETAEATAGGWFHSGDLCRQDADGFIWVVDRKKDMIVSGGENIYCAEVESALSSHPGIVDVAVVGIPHPRWVETPLAVVVPADAQAPPAAADVIAHAAARLASFKKPTAVWFVDELPRNASGKVLKNRLREDFAAAEDVTTTGVTA